MYFYLWSRSRIQYPVCLFLLSECFSHYYRTFHKPSVQKDPSHPSRGLFTLRLSRRRYCGVTARLVWLQDTFYPQAISLLYTMLPTGSSHTASLHFCHLLNCQHKAHTHVYPLSHNVFAQKSVVLNCTVLLTPKSFCCCCISLYKLTVHTVLLQDDTVYRTDKLYYLTLH